MSQHRKRGFLCISVLGRIRVKLVYPVTRDKLFYISVRVLYLFGTTQNNIL
jgi:hypothetical protein